MAEYFSFELTNSPAEIIAKAHEIIKNNIPPGTNLNVPKIIQDDKCLSILYKSDLGIRRNCFVRVKAIRGVDAPVTQVIIEGCTCGKMLRLYYRLRDELK